MASLHMAGRMLYFKVDFQDAWCDGMDWIHVRVQW